MTIHHSGADTPVPAADDPEHEPERQPESETAHADPAESGETGAGTGPDAESASASDADPDAETRTAELEPDAEAPAVAPDRDAETRTAELEPDAETGDGGGVPEVSVDPEPLADPMPPPEVPPAEALAAPPDADADVDAGVDADADVVEDEDEVSEVEDEVSEVEDDVQPSPPVTPAKLVTGIGTFQDRWDLVQVDFVEDPRQAVERADGLVADVVDEIMRALATEREQLGGAWRDQEEATTEDLRLAFQRYRTVFQRLLRT